MGECIALAADQAGGVATCEIEYQRLIEVTDLNAPIGTGKVVGDTEFGRHTPQPGAQIRCDLVANGAGWTLPDRAYCVGANYTRARCANGSCTVDWYSDDFDGDGNAGALFPGTNMTVMGGVLTVNAALRPDMVAHWWTHNPSETIDWKSPSREGKNYIAEIRFRTNGSAALRIGLDRWTVADSPGYVDDCNWIGTGKSHNNCEDYTSDWYQTNGRWVTVRLPVF